MSTPSMPSQTASDAQYPLPPRVVDVNFYLDERQYEREMQSVLLPGWFPVCHAKELASAKDYVVWDQLRQSVMIVRQPDGSLAAFHNVCQHRGARLVEKSGHCKHGRFKCPWHGFSYDVTGKCVSIPLRESFDDAHVDGLRLPPVRVTEWNGLVWICLSEATPPLAQYLGVLHDELAWYGMERFEIRYRASVELNANWKVVVDAFNETWHVPFTHEATLLGMMQWRDARIRVQSPHSWMTLPIANYTERKGPGSDHHEANVCHYLCFPNTIFSCFPTHLQMWSAWPLSPTRTVLSAWGLVGPAPQGMSEEEWSEVSDRNWAHFLSVVSEDSKIINDFGTVAHSLGFRRNIFNRAESRLSAFYDEVMKRIGTTA